MDLKKEVSTLYNKYKFRASPVLDQYFLINEGAIQRAIQYADVNSNDVVLEIGPGLGFITRELSKNAKTVYAIEKDRRLEELLNKEVNSANIEYIFQDFLKMNNLPEFNKTVSAIPYSASAPITFRLLQEKFDTAVLFYQKEFGEKMTCKAGHAEYGRLSVMAQYYFNAEYKETVPRTYFYPQPKVDSCIIKLTKKDVPYDERFNIFVREIFRYKNKKVSNAMDIAFRKTITDDRKVDTLTVQEVRELYEKTK